MGQVTTITFFKYQGFSKKFWALKMMGLMPLKISKIEGQSFFRLMGTGRDKFSPLPDWSTYALLQVWDSEQIADRFFEHSDIYKTFCNHSKEQFTIYMKSISSKGEWLGKNPFIRSSDLDMQNNKVAVITRATIRLTRLISFWSYVPKSRRDLKNNKGLIYTQGIGAMPFVQMATFSLWNSKDDILKFAYQQNNHAEAIAKTRKLNWYKEELFARFQPYKTLGHFSDIKINSF